MLCIRWRHGHRSAESNLVEFGNTCGASVLEFPWPSQMSNAISSSLLKISRRICDLYTTLHWMIRTEISLLPKYIPTYCTLRECSSLFLESLQHHSASRLSFCELLFSVFHSLLFRSWPGTLCPLVGVSLHVTGVSFGCVGNSRVFPVSGIQLG